MKPKIRMWAYYNPFNFTIYIHRKRWLKMDANEQIKAILHELGHFQNHKESSWDVLLGINPAEDELIAQMNGIRLALKLKMKSIAFDMIQDFRAWDNKEWRSKAKFKDYAIASRKAKLRKLI